jgi:hypothetical protein
VNAAVGPLSMHRVIALIKAKAYLPILAVGRGREEGGEREGGAPTTGCSFFPSLVQGGYLLSLLPSLTPHPHPHPHSPHHPQFLTRIVPKIRLYHHLPVCWPQFISCQHGSKMYDVISVQWPSTVQVLRFT